MTQEVLADCLSEAGFPFTQTMIAKLERGARPTPVEEAIAIANLLETPLLSLLRPEDTAFLRGLDEAVNKSMSAELDLADAVRRVLVQRGVLAGYLDEQHPQRPAELTASIDSRMEVAKDLQANTRGAAAVRNGIYQWVDGYDQEERERLLSEDGVDFLARTLLGLVLLDREGD